MNDQNIVDKILKNTNINPKTFLKSIRTKCKKFIKKKTDEAFEKGVFGAPTFLVNNKIFWGQDRLEYAIARSKKIVYFFLFPLFLALHFLKHQIPRLHGQHF